jgi:hypothetical protein
MGGNKLKTAGEVTLKIALLGVICSFVLYVCGLGLEKFVCFIDALGVILVSFLLMVTGIILSACGRSQSKKQKNKTSPQLKGR